METQPSAPAAAVLSVAVGANPPPTAAKYVGRPLIEAGAPVTFPAVCVGATTGVVTGLAGVVEVCANELTARKTSNVRMRVIVSFDPGIRLADQNGNGMVTLRKLAKVFRIN